MNERKKNSDDQEIRSGEVALPIDPATLPADAGVVFIGHVRTPWTERDKCPRNSLQADKPCTIHVDAPYRQGLTSVESCSHLIVLYWMDRARRDLIIQAPRHANGTRGCFALRTPVRPNPISLAVVELLECDREAGTLTVMGIDCLDRTPLLDIKPYFASTDSIAEAQVGWRDERDKPFEPDAGR